MNDKLLSRAATYELEQELKNARLLEEKAKRDAKKGTQERIDSYSLAQIESRKGEMNARRLVGHLERDAALIRKAVTFINPTLSAVAPLCPGAITLIGAASGTGKSTATAAIAGALYKEGRKTFIISNEETEAKVLARIACAEVGIDFNQYVQDKVPQSIRKQVAAEIKNIEPFVTVADDAVATTTIESVQKLLQEVDDSGEYSCIVVDFLQRIVKSTVMPGAERVQALYAFKDAITDYAQHAKTPVVLMTQLIPLSSDETERNVESRIKWVRAAYEAAATVIEVIKVRGVPVSTFYIAKGRFTRPDVSVSCKFDNGKFSYLSKQQLQELKMDASMSKLTSILKDDEDPDVNAP